MHPHLIAVMLLALAAAACSPASGVPVARAQTAAAPAYPEIVAGEADGQVFEYH